VGSHTRRGTGCGETSEDEKNKKVLKSA